MNNEIDALDEIKEEIKRKLEQMSPRQRAQLIIEKYLEVENPSEHLVYSFMEWLTESQHEKERCEVLQNKLKDI